MEPEKRHEERPLGGRRPRRFLSFIFLFGASVIPGRIMGSGDCTACCGRDRTDPDVTFLGPSQ